MAWMVGRINSMLELKSALTLSEASILPICDEWIFESFELIVVLIVAQPDGVQRGLVGEIIGRFEKRGFKLIAMKLVHATPEHLEKR